MAITMFPALSSAGAVRPHTQFESKFWELHISVVFYLVTTTWRRFRHQVLFFLSFCFTRICIVVLYWTLLISGYYFCSFRRRRLTILVEVCFWPEPWHQGNLGSIMFELIQFFSSYFSAFLCAVCNLLPEFCHSLLWMDSKFCLCRYQTTHRGVLWEGPILGNHV